MKKLLVLLLMSQGLETLDDWFASEAGRVGLVLARPDLAARGATSGARIIADENSPLEIGSSLSFERADGFGTCSHLAHSRGR